MLAAESDDVKRLLGWHFQPNLLNLVMWPQLIVQEVGSKLQLCVQDA